MTHYCRACGGALRRVLDLGEMPLVNELHADPEESVAQERYPLRLAVCPECMLAQIEETVDPSRLFNGAYPYYSSQSQTFVAHARQMAVRLLARHLAARVADPFVVEIGSNDGYLLRHIAEFGVRCLGVEPSESVAAAAEADGIRTLRRFWGRALAEEIAETEGQADLIIANNVMAHMPDIHDAVAGIATLLRPDGVFVAETPYVGDLLQACAFDTIYHEHTYYYSLAALCRLLHRHGLVVIDVERFPRLHGGSIRVTARRSEHCEPSSAVMALLREESRNGLMPYERFAERAQRRMADLRWLYGRIGPGAAFGAAAKGAVLINACGLEASIAYAVDCTPAKQGMHVPGTRIPILPLDILRERRPPHALMTCWNFAEEALERSRAWREGGGRFIVPMPEVRIL